MSGGNWAGERVARCIIFATHFDGAIATNAYLFRFVGNSEPDGSTVESVVWRRFAPTDQDVHDYGCRLAEKQNSRTNPPPGPKRRYYCGFREADAQSLEIVDAEFNTHVVPHEEDGEKAHCNLILRYDNSLTTKAERAGARTAAGLLIAHQFGEPFSYVCPCDKNDGEHPLNRLGQDCLKAA